MVLPILQEHTKKYGTYQKVCLTGPMFQMHRTSLPARVGLIFGGMARTGKKKRYTQKSVYPGITPRIASAGVQQALKVLEGRWKLTILFELFGGRTLRFSELERAIPGVTQKMLIQQLRDLERDGVVRRLVHPVVPPKVEYSLTRGGEELCPALDELLFWAQRWKGQPTSTEVRKPPVVSKKRD